MKRPAAPSCGHAFLLPLTCAKCATWVRAQEAGRGG